MSLAEPIVEGAYYLRSDGLVTGPTTNVVGEMAELEVIPTR